MIIISHRANLTGKNSTLENHPNSIFKALSQKFFVEIDVWVIKCKLKLGHDEPTYDVEKDFLIKNKSKLFLHAKNHEAFIFLKNLDLNVFWHQNDDIVLTNWGFIWTFPNKVTLKNRIEVVLNPEKFSELPDCYGICTDNPLFIRKKLGDL